MHLKSPFPDISPTPDTNAHSVLVGLTAQWPDFTLYIDGETGRKRKFSEFMTRIKDTMTGLASSTADGGLGISGVEGNNIGIVSDNVMAMLVHALLALTVPFSLISAFSTPFELAHALDLTKATHLFVHPRLLPSVFPVARKAGLSSRRIFLLGGRASGFRSLFDIIERTRSSKLPQQQVRNAKKDTLAYLVFSSGTSGLPKAVMISHGNLICSFLQASILAKAVREVYQPPAMPTEDGLPRTLAYLPMHHSYGLHTYCFRSFLTPTTYVFLRRWNTEIALKMIPKYKITSLPLIPSVVHQIVNYSGIHKVDLSSIRSMTNGAAYLPPELANKMSKLVPKDIFFGEGYGMSEGTIAAITRPFPGLLDGRLTNKPGTTGVLLPGIEGRLLRDDGSETEVGEVGELFLKGGNVALGYWRNEQATSETFISGWLRTGDKFRVDSDGYFFFADRAKDTLKVSGTQVSPVEIENVLLNHPDKLISDATVAGVSGGRTKDEKVPRAWVVLNMTGKKHGKAAVIQGGSKLCLQAQFTLLVALESWHQENLSKYKWLRGGIEVVEEIPKSPTGKTLRRVLVERYERRRPKQAKSRL